MVDSLGHAEIYAISSYGMLYFTLLKRSVKFMVE